MFVYRFLRGLRGLAAVIGGWQIIGLLPVLGWLQNLGAVTGGMLAILVLKGGILLIAFALVAWLRRVVNRGYVSRGHQAPIASALSL